MYYTNVVGIAKVASHVSGRAGPRRIEEGHSRMYRAVTAWLGSGFVRSASRHAWRGWGRPWAVVAIAGVLLGGCDTVPDSLNPFAKEKPYESETAVDTSAIPGAKDPHPNLATVPDRPKLVLSGEQRRAVVEGLISDRDNAVYTDGTGPGRATKPGQAPEVTAAAREPVRSLAIEQPGGGEALATVLFPAGASDLPATSKSTVLEAAAIAVAREGRLQIIGFADPADGSESDKNASLQLAAERAQAVAFALMQQGVARDRLSTSANTSDAGLGRAEIYLSQ